MVGILLSVACRCFQQCKNVGGIEKISCIDTDTGIYGEISDVRIKRGD